MTLFACAHKNFLKDADISQKSKQKLDENSRKLIDTLAMGQGIGDFEASQIIQNVHLAYLMGKTDGLKQGKEIASWSIQGNKEA